VTEINLDAAIVLKYIISHYSCPSALPVLITIFLWFILSFAFWGSGKLLANNFGPASMREDYPETSYFFLGLSLTGLISGLWWIFFPVNYLFAAILTGLGIGYGLACLPAFPDINFRKPLFLLISGLFFLGVLMKSAGPTSFYDCGLYYVQTMRWVQQFPVVPGLANVHIRFGNASLWHIFSAAYDIPALWKGNFDSLGELMLFWFLSFHAWQVFSQTGFERYLSLGLIIAGSVFTVHLLGAPSPDFACGILGMHTLWQFRKFLRYWNPERPNQLNTRGLTLFVQSIFLAGIKLSALPFLVIAMVVCFLVMREGWYRQTGKLVILGIAALSAMVYRSYLLTGWIFFPVFQGNLNPDWKISHQETQEYIHGVKGFARHIPSKSELSFGLSYEKIASLDFSQWFPIWARDRSPSDWLFVLGGVAGWVFLFLYAGNKVRKRFSSQWPLIFFTWLSGMLLLFWFSNAPDPRFGIAALGSGFSYFVASILIRFEKLSPKVLNSIMQPGLIMFAGAILFLYRDLRTLRENPVVPASYHRPRLETFMLADGSAGFTPSDVQEKIYLDADMCWDAPLPCSINEKPGLKRRGKSLQDGFIMVITSK